MRIAPILLLLLVLSPFGSALYRDLYFSQGYISPPFDQRSYGYHYPGFSHEYTNPYWFKGYRGYTHAAYKHPALYGYGYGLMGPPVSPRWG